MPSCTWGYPVASNRPGVMGGDAGYLWMYITLAAAFVMFIVWMDAMQRTRLQRFAEVVNETLQEQQRVITHVSKQNEEFADTADSILTILGMVASDEEEDTDEDEEEEGGSDGDEDEESTDEGSVGDDTDEETDDDTDEETGEEVDDDTDEDTDGGKSEEDELASIVASVMLRVARARGDRAVCIALGDEDDDNTQEEGKGGAKGARTEAVGPDGDNEADGRDAQNLTPQTPLKQNETTRRARGGATRSSESQPSDVPRSSMRRGARTPSTFADEGSDGDNGGASDNLVNTEEAATEPTQTSK